METPKRKPQRFNDSFKPTVPLGPDEFCNLKRHYRGCAREVIGLLDKLAANDPERFVFISVPAIVKRCNKHNDGAPYRRRAVEYVLTYLRQHHVISKVLMRIRPDIYGHQRSRLGFIVTPHDSLAIREKGCCDFKGALHASGRWESSGPGGVIWWAGQSQISSGTPARLEPGLSQNAESVRPSVRGSVRSEDGKCAGQCAEQQQKNSAQPEAKTTACAPSVRLSLEEPSHRTEKNLEEPCESKAREAVVLFDDPKSESGTNGMAEQYNITIAEYFGGLAINYQPDSACDFLERAGFDRLTNDTVNRYAAPCQEFKHWPELTACCEEVIERISGLPFAGNITLAKVMVDAMLLLKEKHNLQAPAPWYPAIKRLREMRHKKVHV